MFMFDPWLLLRIVTPSVLCFDGVRRMSPSVYDSVFTMLGLTWHVTADDTDTPFAVVVSTPASIGIVETFETVIPITVGDCAPNVFSIPVNCVPLRVALELPTVTGVTPIVPLMISESDVATATILFELNETDTDVLPIAVCVEDDVVPLVVSNTTPVFPEIASASETDANALGCVVTDAVFVTLVIVVVADVTAVLVCVTSAMVFDTDPRSVVVSVPVTVVFVADIGSDTTDITDDVCVLVTVDPITLVVPIVDALTVDDVLDCCAVTVPSVGDQLNPPHDDSSQSIYLI